MHEEAQEDDIFEAFSEYGDIKTLDVAYHGTTVACLWVGARGFGRGVVGPKAGRSACRKISSAIDLAMQRPGERRFWKMPGVR